MEGKVNAWCSLAAAEAAALIDPKRRNVPGKLSLSQAICEKAEKYFFHPGETAEINETGNLKK